MPTHYYGLPEVNRHFSGVIVRKLWAFLWYGIGDSNSYVFRHRDLNTMRLPIPPIPHIELATTQPGG